MKKSSKQLLRRMELESIRRDEIRKMFIALCRYDFT